MCPGIRKLQRKQGCVWRLNMGFTHFKHHEKIKLEITPGIHLGASQLSQSNCGALFQISHNPHFNHNPR